MAELVPEDFWEDEEDVCGWSYDHIIEDHPGETPTCSNCGAEFFDDEV